MRNRAVLVVAALFATGAGMRAAAEDPVKDKPANAPVRENRLAKERSPYLRQHMRNPVDWYPWGAEAFERAKKEGKPIFLSIGYAACHWCHVMEHESFEDEGAAAALNDAFVCVKVDREERPDVDDVYMAAVQITSGRGGWPMTCILAPDAKPFLARTYLPRSALLAIDLDAHEQLVHQPRRRVVLERLVLHHVAPVAGGVADAQQDGLVLAPRFFEGIVAPRVPVDRVVRVLEQIGALLVNQAVGALRVLGRRSRIGS